MKKFLLAFLLAFAPLAANAQTVDNPGGIIPGAVTNCSSVASLCLNLQNPAGTTVFSVDKTGIASFVNGGSSAYLVPVIRPIGNTTGFAFGNTTTYVSANGIGIASFLTSGVQPIVLLKSSAQLCWGNADINGSCEVSLYRDAANTIGLRNGTNAQTLNIYNIYTDALNYERLTLGYDVSNNAFLVSGNMAGTGTHRNLELSGGGNVLGLGMAASAQVNWTILGGHLLAGTDNTYDIGASGTNRPRNVYVAGTIAAGGTISSSGAVVGTTALSTGVVAVASLGTCSSGQEGNRRAVNDATQTLAAGIGTAVAGSGSNHVPVYCDGTSWKIG